MRRAKSLRNENHADQDQADARSSAASPPLLSAGTCASSVSGMNVAADIGTAKLMGAMETSFMNEKNETAIAQVEMITHPVARDQRRNALPMAPGRKS